MKRTRTRSAKDPRVVEIMAALDRAINSFARGPADGFARDQSLVPSIAESILAVGCDRFLVPVWSDAAIRAVLLAFALHAPAEDLDDMVERARGEMEWLAGYELEHAISTTGATARPSCGAEAN